MSISGGELACRLLSHSERITPMKFKTVPLFIVVPISVLVQGCADIPAGISPLTNIPGNISPDFSAFGGGNPLSGGNFRLPGNLDNKDLQKVVAVVAVGILVKNIVDNANAQQVRETDLARLRNASVSQKVAAAQNSSRNAQRYTSSLQSTKSQINSKSGSGKFKTTREEKAELSKAEAEIKETRRAAEKQSEFFKREAKAIQSDPSKAQALEKSANDLGTEAKKLRVLEKEYAGINNRAVF